MACKLAAIVQKFLTVQIQIKTFHWQTFSYSKHKSADELFDQMIDLTDQFVETFMGKQDRRLDFSKGMSPKIIRLQNISYRKLSQILKQFDVFLIKLDGECLSSDLLNIRDELLGAVHRTQYLLSLR